ncbi:MAG: hypothetical protein ACRDMZ_03900, partial [Solirubrobacteraceae bacterium]
MAFPELSTLRSRLASDRELARCARYFTGAVRLGVGKEQYAVHFESGKVTAAGKAEAPPGAHDVTLSAAASEWDKLLAPVPPPFYQDPFGASLHHAVSLGGEPETLFAYYPA